MRSFVKLLAIVLCLLVSNVHAQVNTKTNSLTLINGTGSLTLSYTGNGPGTVVFPEGNSTLVSGGTLNGQTLAWNNGMWAPMSNLLNTGTGVSITTGNLTVTNSIISQTGSILASQFLGTYYGDGANITSLNASNITSGTLADARLSSNIPRLNAGVNVFMGAIAASSFSGTFFGDGTALVALNASNITTGTLNDARLTSNIPRLDAGVNTFTGGVAAPSFSGTFIGDGTALTPLSAGNIIGTLNDMRLSSNIPRLNAGVNVFMGAVAASSFSGTFFGDGTALVALNASNITTGTLSLARISTAGATPDQVLTYNGSALVYADAPSGFEIPYSHTGLHDEVMFDLVNTSAVTPDSGAAVHFEIDNSNSAAAVLHVETNGVVSGKAISATATFGTGLEASSSNGIGAMVSSEYGDGLRVTSENGVGGRFRSNNGPYAIHATNYNTIDGSGAFIQSDNDTAVIGYSVTGIGGAFISQDSVGVSGYSTNGPGVKGYSIDGHAGSFTSETGIAGQFSSTYGKGIEVSSFISSGIAAHSVGSYAGEFTSNSALTMLVVNNSGGGDVARFISPNGHGIFSTCNTIGTAASLHSSAGIGVRGSSGTSYGAYLLSGSGHGAFIESTSGTGAHIRSQSGIGLRAEGDASIAGYFTSTNGYGILSVSTNFYGGVFQSTTGTGLSASSRDNIGLEASSINSTGLLASTGAAGQYAGHFKSDSAGANGVQIDAGAEGIALRITNGGLVGSYISIESGEEIPNDVIIVNIEENADNTPSTAILPNNPTNGKMLFVTCPDLDGFEINGIIHPGQTMRQWIYAGNVWVSQD